MFPGKFLKIFKTAETRGCFFKIYVEPQSEVIYVQEKYLSFTI